MLKEIISKLITGDKDIVDQFTNAKAHWDELLKNFNWNDQDALEEMARLVYKSQFKFEDIGGRWNGQEIMVVVGIGQYYNNKKGFGSNLKKAKLIRDAILMSYCSMEVKLHAKSITQIYDLDDFESSRNLTF